eukprot:9211759-Heterocapsa_arctica.AAC.1
MLAQRRRSWARLARARRQLPPPIPSPLNDVLAGRVGLQGLRHVARCSVPDFIVLLYEGICFYDDYFFRIPNSERVESFIKDVIFRRRTSGKRRRLRYRATPWGHVPRGRPKRPGWVST